ncbi:FMN-binding protein [Streptomyces sp. Act143]|uniref:FMN-binding protein n=1 Tax=Streptomyces sp. Act143 TaxID=2200760 RepID=UPI000D6737A7|nr:FMN-binding protein [Streptomyces sp. Act143]PWI16865.1 FMN-binding protein [Streptomyces sp. Act143]
MRKKHPFRHALLATVGTVSGIVLLLALKPTTDPSLPAAAPAATSRTAVSAPSATSAAPAPVSPAPSKADQKNKRTPSPTASASHPPSTAPTRTGTATPSAPRTTSPAPAPATRTVTGATAETKYGPVQVRITVTGGRITAADAVQSPDETARSRDINSTAIPRLDQETLQAQSARIDTVSGATYTSAGYRQSLQSALDRAGL